MSSSLGRQVRPRSTDESVDDRTTESQACRSRDEARTLSLTQVFAEHRSAESVPVGETSCERVLRQVRWDSVPAQPFFEIPIPQAGLVYSFGQGDRLRIDPSRRELTLFLKDAVAKDGIRSGQAQVIGQDTRTCVSQSRVHPREAGLVLQKGIERFGI